MKMTSDHCSDDLILQLSKVARGLEDEGQLNLAKLFRAAVEAEIHRHSQARPRQGDGLEEALRSAVADLSARGTTPEPMKAAMAYGVETFERGNAPLLEDIPDPHVCYQCGHVSIGFPSGLCPTCFARPYSFKEIPPIYFLRQSTNASEVENLLQENLRDIEASVDGVNEADADKGVWPMREMMAHLMGAQMIMFNRSKRMLTEHNPNLGSIPRSEVDAIHGAASQSIADMLESYRSTRQELMTWFRGRSNEELSRPGLHPEWGQFTILSQVAYIARHEQLHLAELQARREGR